MGSLFHFHLWSPLDRKGTVNSQSEIKVSISNDFLSTVIRLFFMKIV